MGNLPRTDHTRVTRNFRSLRHSNPMSDRVVLSAVRVDNANLWRSHGKRCVSAYLIDMVHVRTWTLRSVEVENGESQ